MSFRMKARLEIRRKAELEALSKEELLEILQEKENKIEELNGLIGKLAEANVILEARFNREKEFEIQNILNSRWVDKLVLAISSANKLVKATEILEILIRQRIGIGRYELGKTCIHLVKAVKFGMVKIYKIKGLKAHYYGLPEWFNENGKLHNEYKLKSKLR